MTQRSTALFKVKNYKEEAAGALGASPSGSHPSLDPPGGTCAVPVASAVLSPRWTALGLRSDAASSTGKPPAPPPLELTATEFARMAPGTACQEEGGGPISVAPETLCYPHGPSPTSAHARHSGCLLPTLGLLTWGGRAPGCRPPVALGGAAPGTGCPAGSPRPCPRRGPGRSTGSSAPPLPHSSGCKRPACTQAWKPGSQHAGDTRKVGNAFQTKQGNRTSCRDQEGRRVSDEVVPGTSVFSSETGMSGNFWGRIKGSK